MPSSFSRYRPLAPRTFALRAFNAHETEINRHYWSFKVVSEYSAYEARQEVKKNPLRATSELFHASGPNSTRIPKTVTDWIVAREELENWLRLSALVSASSYLEVYLRQVVRSALMSDPLCRFGAARTVDGVKFLKDGIELAFDHELELVTRGDWQSRFARRRSLAVSLKCY
jgi:hypothetical protein